MQGEVRTDTPVIETSSGRVRGYQRAGIHTFLGLAYGGDTGGAGRFLPPAPPKPWSGVRLAYSYGDIAPQFEKRAASLDDASYFEGALLNGPQGGVASEDCLRLNVWSPGLDDARRPVMVWLHGGHFSTGSGHALAAYEGSNLSRRGDVVVVTLNHRLNVLGHLNLASVGGEYATSMNVGMLDIVLALQWVQDNIARFGGDRDCVTIFGQSGGGGKVTTLLAMPEAAGLFHRAIVQSNIGIRQSDVATSLSLSEAVFYELGMAGGDLRRLQTLPYDVLSRAEQAAVARLCPPVNPARRNQRVRWEPVVDGHSLPRHGGWPDAPAQSAHVPLLVGTTLNEFTHAIGRPDLERMDFAAVAAEFAVSFGEAGEEIIDTLRRRHPHAQPFDILSRGYSATVRECAVRQAQSKAAQGSEPAWLYWFCWQTPVLDGRPRAYHNAELPFVFNNVERCALATGNTAAARLLGETMSDAWISFARHGNPSHAGLPEWSPVTTQGSQTMIFDTVPLFSDDPDSAERVLTGAA